MASPFFSGRIPQELYDRVDQHIKESGEGKTQILINALSQYLGIEISTSKSININIDLLFSELESLKDRVELLERSQPKQLSLLSHSPVSSDNKVITKSKIDNKLTMADNATDNKFDNSVMVLTSKEVTELTGIPRGTFEDRHRSGKLPISKNGYTIIAHAVKQTEKPFASLWEVQTGNT